MACALLYNFKDAARLQKVRFALFKLGVSGRIVAPEGAKILSAGI